MVIKDNLFRKCVRGGKILSSENVLEVGKCAGILLKIPFSNIFSNGQVNHFFKWAGYS